MSIKTPIMEEPAFIAPDASIHGNVKIEKDASVFFHAVIRSENELIRIGQRTNIQDGCVLHTDTGFEMSIGADCTIGHGAILHGCTIGDNTLIGMGAIVLNGAVIGKNCIVGAGALVPQGKVIPDGSLVVGFPGKVKREVTPEDIADNAASAAGYVAEGLEYRKMF